MQDENWPRAIHKAYGYRNLLSLQNDWMHWIQQGRPAIQPVAETILAATTDTTPIRAADPIARGQNRGSSPTVKPVSLLASNQSTQPAMMEQPARQGVSAVTEPWTGKAASKDRADSQVATTVTWPATTGNLAKASPHGSIYDAARKRGTLYR
jgi:hypothetical protein